MHLRPAILLFGDSITQYAFGEGAVELGWASLLSSVYQRRADVYNRGFSGYNTQHALEVVPRVFAPHNYLFATLFFGANDAALPGERQHVPVEEYGENMEKIIIRIRECSSSEASDSECSKNFPLIVMTPPPVDEEAWRAELGIDKSDRTNEQARIYGLKAKEVARKLGCPVLDTWELLGGESENYGQFLCDGLHLNEGGNRRVFAGLMSLIKREFPEIAPQEYVDGEYRGGGIPVEEKLWTDLC